MPTTTQNKETRIVTGDGYQGYLANKRKTVFVALDKNPLLTPSTLAKVLEIPSNEYKKEKAYLKKLKYEWRGNHPKQRGSIRCVPDEVHNVFYKGELKREVVGHVREVVGRVLDRSGGAWCFGVPVSGVGCGWTLTKSPNHFMLYKNQLGRIRLFDTGTVEIYIRKPANKGKAMQLFSYAFVHCGLIDSIKVVDEFQSKLLTRMHATFDVGQQLPYLKIDAFKDSHGFSATLGDRTHPTCAEFMFEYNSEVTAAREIFAQVGELLKSLGGPSEVKRLSNDYSR